MWNNYSTVIEQLPCTHYSVKSWHNTLNSMLSTKHLSIRKLRNALQNEEKLTQAKIGDYTAGKEYADPT